MDDLRIEPFTANDLEFGKRLTDAEAWGRSQADWLRLLRIEPDGVFKAMATGIPVGVAGVTSYGEVAWIHSVIVREEWRGKGIGRELMRKCVDYAKAHGAGCIKLDSVNGQEAFYENLGFVREFESFRYVADGGRGTVAAEQAAESDMPEICEFDRDICGLDRSRVLLELFRENPGWVFLSRAKGEIIGYIMARPSEIRIEIGPCVALGGSEDIWQALVKSVMTQTVDRKARICVPGIAFAADARLSDLGFEKVAVATRMFTGKVAAESEACIGMISPEKG